MSRSVQRGNLGDARQQARLRQIVSDFELAWVPSPTLQSAPGLSGSLPPPGDPLRLAALEALIRVDLRARWQRRGFVLLEQYLEQFPELGEGRALSPSL